MMLIGIIKKDNHVIAFCDSSHTPDLGTTRARQRNPHGGVSPTSSVPFISFNMGFCSQQ